MTPALSNAFARTPFQVPSPLLSFLIPPPLWGRIEKLGFFLLEKTMFFLVRGKAGLWFKNLTWIPPHKGGETGRTAASHDA
jgi:hypothetical protein